jgi:hypothetical protein
MSDADTLTLDEFLRARIAEDEARVRSLTGEWPDEVAVVPRSRGVAGCVAVSLSSPKAYVRVYANASPDFGWLYHESGVVVWSDEIAARVLAECEAKRKLVDMHETIAAAYPIETVRSCRVCSVDGEYPRLFPCETIRLLAVGYAVHPDYRDAWKP